jgi:signal transduction histidine kinase
MSLAAAISLLASTEAAFAQDIAPWSERGRIKDSLKATLATETDYSKQVRLLHDIIDLSEGNGEGSANVDYSSACRQLLKISTDHRDESLQLEALVSIGSNDADSIVSCIRRIESLPETNEQKGTLVFMRYLKLSNDLVLQDDSARYGILLNAIRDYRNDPGTDPFSKTQRLLDLCAVMNRVTTDDLFIEYLKELGDLIGQLPEDGRSYIPNAYYVILANTYSHHGMQKEAYAADVKLLEFIDGLESKYKEQGRKYRSKNINKYLSYRRMLLCSDVLSVEQITGIYRKMEELSLTTPEIARDFNEKTSISKVRYYVGTKNYAKAIPILDTILVNGLNKSFRSECLKDRVMAGRNVAHDPDLAKYAVMYLDYLQSEQHNSIKSKAMELQIVYDVNELERHVSDLELEKDRAKIRTNRIMIFITTAALILLLLFLIFVLRSRSELSKANRELEIARRKAELASRMKTMFVENVNHEIRTPLNAIVGFSNLLSEDDTMTPDEKKSYVRIISDNSEMLLTMVGDLLDLSEMEAGEMTFRKSRSSLNDICSSSLDSYAAKVGEGVSLVFVPHDPDKIMDVDRQRIAQVLRNYISNAVKNTVKGSITVDYADDPEERKVTFSVTDTGCGVPPEKAEEIFVRFEKLDVFKEGTGVGLSICRSIADGMKAEAKLDVSYTGGARFLFILPY